VRTSTACAVPVIIPQISVSLPSPKKLCFDYVCLANTFDNSIDELTIEIRLFKHIPTTEIPKGSSTANITQ